MFGAFSFFDGVPQSILYDNTKIAVARILGDGKGERTRGFAELQSHCLIRDSFWPAWQGQWQSRGLVGYARRNFLATVFESFEAINAYLVECWRRRMADRLRSHNETIAQRPGLLAAHFSGRHRKFPVMRLRGHVTDIGHSTHCDKSTIDKESRRPALFRFQ